MDKAIWLNRTEAELLVDILEDNYRTGKFEPAGAGADLACEIRQQFGMVEQSPLKYKSETKSDNEN